MKKYNVLVLTDHSGHSDQNSVYALLREMATHHQCKSIDIATRGFAYNHLFFEGMQRDALIGCKVSSDFHYAENGAFFKDNRRKLKVMDYNLIFLRLPRPISDEYLKWLSEVFSHAVIINHPRGIIATSNKNFLLNFPSICPNIRLCRTIEDVKEELAKHPIVLKPLREYGGRGLLKIHGDQLDDGTKVWSTEEYLPKIQDELIFNGYLSMRFLKNVSQGDKRILVVGGEIMAASLRLPAKGSWLCNVAQGGRSVGTEITADEVNIVKTINPSLSEQGIVMYGVDTLVDDDGIRVLSEINTLSIGGWPQAQKQTGAPIIKRSIDKIFKYADEQ